MASLRPKPVGGALATQSRMLTRDTPIEGFAKREERAEARLRREREERPVSAAQSRANAG